MKTSLHGRRLLGLALGGALGMMALWACTPQQIAILSAAQKQGCITVENLELEDGRAEDVCVGVEELRAAVRSVLAAKAAFQRAAGSPSAPAAPASSLPLARGAALVPAGGAALGEGPARLLDVERSAAVGALARRRSTARRGLSALGRVALLRALARTPLDLTDKQSFPAKVTRAAGLERAAGFTTKRH